MTDAQFQAQQQLLQSILDKLTEGVSVLHYMSGVAEFSAHLLTGLVYLGLGYGIVLASELRRKG